MKIRNTLIIIYLLFASCNSTQPPPYRAEIQKMFNVAAGVQEIKTVSILVTTTGENTVTYSTTLKENGAPIETATYNKDGKIEKTEPWVSAKEGEFEGSKVKQEFDKEKNYIPGTVQSLTRVSKYTKQQLTENTGSHT